MNKRDDGKVLRKLLNLSQDFLFCDRKVEKLHSYPALGTLKGVKEPQGKPYSYQEIEELIDNNDAMPLTY